MALAAKSISPGAMQHCAANEKKAAKKKKNGGQHGGDMVNGGVCGVDVVAHGISEGISTGICDEADHGRTRSVACTQIYV